MKASWPSAPSSKYLSGSRTDDWLKIKTSKRQEVVIAGFTAPRRTRPFFGALALAVREKDSWRYIGHVGTGFSHKTLEELHGKLMPLRTAKSPFSAKVKDEAVTTWVKPSLVAEVKFTEWTKAGEMRHPVYLGLRSGQASQGRCAGTGKAARLVAACSRHLAPLGTLCTLSPYRLIARWTHVVDSSERSSCQLVEP